ncbi:MAG: hypothetical protein GJU77_06520 [Ferrovum sp.]|nr:hypothetical protein [Ferrovum sp.]NDU90171.1 hypothetical protein [Ferrovum sp.]
MKYSEKDPFRQRLISDAGSRDVNAGQRIVYRGRHIGRMALEKMQEGYRQSMSAAKVVATLVLPIVVVTGTFVHTANASTITDGTYISDFYGTVGGSTQGFYSTPGGYNYTNGILSQTNTVSDLFVHDSATSTANLSGNKLSLNLFSGNGGTQGFAEMWDTLTLGNLPSGGTINTLLGTLSMTVTTSLGGMLAQMNLFNTGNFTTYGGDCLMNSSCGGFIFPGPPEPVYEYTGLPAGSTTFSVPITLGDLTGGQVAYIAGIQGGTKFH